MANVFLTLDEFCQRYIDAARSVVDKQHPDKTEAERAKMAEQVACAVLMGWSEADNFGMAR